MSPPLKESLKAAVAVIVGWVAGAYLFTDGDWRSVLSWWFVYFLVVLMISSYLVALRRQRRGE